MECSPPPPAPDRACLRIRGFELDLERRELRTPTGEQALLRRKALEVLLVLAQQAGHVVSKDELLARVWSPAVVTDDSLTQVVNEIRRLLGDTDRSVIRTLARRGYVLVPDARALVHELPRRAAAAAHRVSNLPATDPALFGRDDDVATVASALREQRLMTIVGAGGIGKTSLAHAVGRRAVGLFEHGVWWIDLATLSEASQVTPAIAVAAGIELVTGDPLQRLVGGLGERELLLVLDNCEHLVAAVAPVIAAVLAGTRRVRVLATSQVALKLGGEHLHRLGVLVVPPADASPAEAAACGAFQLLVRRVAEARQDFELAPATVPLAIDICRRLDGVPLAIEMAAARIPTLGVSGVHTLLGEHLRMLRNDRRMAPSRQETLRATLEWSCSLLSPTELSALRRLSVFAGPFELAHARRVITTPDLDEWAALDALCALVDRSLVRAEGVEPVRYRLLETTRVLAREMLFEAGEADAAMQRHSRAMASQWWQIRKAFMSSSDDELLDRFVGSYADMQKAYEYACDRADADTAAAVLIGLRSLDQLSGDTLNTPARLPATRALLPHATGVARARLLTTIATCSWVRDEHLPPRLAAELAVAEWLRLTPPEPMSLSHTLLLLATELAKEGEAERARKVLAQARAVARTMAHPKVDMITAIHAGHVAMYCGDAADFLAHMREALDLARKHRATRVACFVQAYLPRAAVMTGDWPAAVAIGSNAVGELRALGQRAFLAQASEAFVRALIEADETQRARAEAAQAIELAWEFGLDAEMAADMALLALRLGQHAHAAALAEYARPRGPVPRNALDRQRQALCKRLCSDLEAVEQATAKAARGPQAGMPSSAEARRLALLVASGANG